MSQKKIFGQGLSMSQIAPISTVSERTGRRRSDRIVGASPATQQVLQQATTASKSDLPILLFGPEGSGREFLANAIHRWSHRVAEPFLVLSVAALPEDLQAREIFGCAEGVHSVLPTVHVGALERARGGTLVLGDAYALHKTVRNQLRSALIRRHFAKQGDARRVVLDSRVIAILRQDDEDLFGDLPCPRIHLRPLRERREDILPLANHFLNNFSDELGMTLLGFSDEARRVLCEADWPGNVAELRECIRQAALLTRRGIVSAETICVAGTPKNIPSFKEAKRAFELRYVQSLLTRCNGNISRAARFAQKDRKDFYDVIRRTGIDLRAFRS